jgi:diketogulonate reductase-like aldo/keto reductase
VRVLLHAGHPEFDPLPAFVYVEGTLLETWKELEALKDEGKLKSIGVSNFRPQDLELLLGSCKHKPVINQVGVSYHTSLVCSMLIVSLA